METYELVNMVEEKFKGESNYLDCLKLQETKSCLSRERRGGVIKRFSRRFWKQLFTGSRRS